MILLSNTKGTKMTKANFWKEMKEQYPDIQKVNNDVYENDTMTIRACGSKKIADGVKNCYKTFDIEYRAFTIEKYNYLIFDK